MKRVLVVGSALMLLAALATGCSTVTSGRTDNIRPSASPALTGPNNIEEISGPAGLWPASS